MRLSRERFVDHFAISIRVRSLRMWNRRAKSPPTHLTTSIYETIFVNNGALPITSAAFGEIVEPVIVELHSKTPRGTRPDDRQVAGLVYDALEKAGVEATIKPPLEAHGR